MDWVSWLLSFIGVIGLVFLLFYALKKLTKRVNVVSGSKLKVLDRVSLGRDSMLLVISVTGKLMLIGVTPQRVEKLCDLEQSEEDYLSGAQTQDFRSVLADLLWKKPQENGADVGKSGSEAESDGGDTDGVGH